MIFLLNSLCFKMGRGLGPCELPNVERIRQGVAAQISLKPEAIASANQPADLSVVCADGR